jgi:hypothetical protein
MKTADPRAFAKAFALLLFGLARQHRLPCALHHPHSPNSSLLHHNVRGNLPAEAGADWPRKDNLHPGLERPDGACRSGSG